MKFDTEAETEADRWNVSVTHFIGEEKKLMVYAESMWFNVY